MLWAEAASETMGRSSAMTTVSDPIVSGRFGERVYTQIRRFVIVQVRRKDHYVKAWFVLKRPIPALKNSKASSPITTYSGRGTLKPGCNAAEHALVYSQGTEPSYFPGEREKGLTKDPIEIIPSNPKETINTASRLRFGRAYPVEWNVKVKEIGMVAPSHMGRLIQYYREEDVYDSDDHSIDGQDDGGNRRITTFSHSNKALKSLDEVSKTTGRDSMYALLSSSTI